MAGIPRVLSDAIDEKCGDMDGDSAVPAEDMFPMTPGNIVALNAHADEREDALRRWWSGAYPKQPWIRDPLDRTNFLMNVVDTLTEVRTEQSMEIARLRGVLTECAATHPETAEYIMAVLTPLA